MRIKPASRIQYILLVLIMLFSPIIVSADAWFSERIDPDISAPVYEDAATKASCHDQKMSNANADCCEHACDCGASSCQSTSATIMSRNQSVFINAFYVSNYLRNHYLSFVTSPSSPPPIA